jgi:hypothetical protein
VKRLAVCLITHEKFSASETNETVMMKDSRLSQRKNGKLIFLIRAAIFIPFLIPLTVLLSVDPSLLSSSTMRLRRLIAPFFLDFFFALFFYQPDKRFIRDTIKMRPSEAGFRDWKTIGEEGYADTQYTVLIENELPFLIVDKSSLKNFILESRRVSGLKQSDINSRY